MAKHPKFDLRKSKNGQYYFNLTAENGQVILTSEMYTQKHNALNGIESVKENSSDDGRYKRADSDKGDPYFTLRAGNHQVIGTSEMYKSNSSRDNGIESIKRNATVAEVEDNTDA